MDRFTKSDEGRYEAVRFYARAMRRNPTPAEKALRRGISRFGKMYKWFHHQIQFDTLYIADVYCPAAKFIVEIDGSSHASAEAKAKDARRDAYFDRRGIRTLRFTNEQVLGDPDGVARQIIAEFRRYKAKKGARNGAPPLDAPTPGFFADISSDPHDSLASLL